MPQYNYLLTISYLGSNYHGSQIQKNALTVQEVIQNALYEIISSNTDVKFCSRTDSGVHAFNFCISFFCENKLKEHLFIPRLNHLLPEDIRALSLKEVPLDFHARYSAKGKKYEYYIWNDKTMSPFWEGRALHLREELDLDTVNEAATHFVGTHDFSAFTSKKCSVDDKVRTVNSITVKRKGDHLYIISISADGFLYNMARIIVGCLIQCNRGKVSSADIDEYLNGRERNNLLITVPAYGLYLREVYY